MNSGTKLSVGDVVSNSISIGLKNFIPLLITGILYVVTVWIPYLNLGTTIGLWDLIAKMGRGESINPTDIFDPKYRARIGEFFLLLTFLAAGTFAGLIILFAGQIIALAWMLALPLFVDKGTDPLESLKLSNQLTYGNKLSIFIGAICLVIVIVIAAMILMFVGAQIAEILGAFLAMLVYLISFPILLGLYAYVYNALAGDEGGAMAGATPAI